MHRNVQFITFITKRKISYNNATSLEWLCYIPKAKTCGQIGRYVIHWLVPKIHKPWGRHCDFTFCMHSVCHTTDIHCALVVRAVGYVRVEITINVVILCLFYTRYKFQKHGDCIKLIIKVNWAYLWQRSLLILWYQ